MRSVTLDEIMAWGPCGCDGPDNGENYTRERVARLMGGRDTVSASDVSPLDISPEDKLWFVLHFLTDAQRHEFACRCAERVLHLCDNREVAQAAIDTKRAWLRGEASNKELAAAEAAARAAAWAAARKWQINQAIAMVDDFAAQQEVKEQ